MQRFDEVGCLRLCYFYSPLVFFWAKASSVMDALKTPLSAVA
jgi:hypothetical protein